MILDIIIVINVLKSMRMSFMSEKAILDYPLGNPVMSPWVTMNTCINWVPDPPERNGKKDQGLQKSLMHCYFCKRSLKSPARIATLEMCTPFTLSSQL